MVFVDEAPPAQTGAFTDVEQGTPVRNDTDGIGRNKFDWTSLYGSQGRLRQCVNMTYLTTKPDNPDDQAKALLGLPFALTGIELLGHEFGHHWLMGANFDKGQGLGVEDLLRACSDNNDGTCSPNLHYAQYVNSGSVMYGNFLTDNGDGTYQVCGEQPPTTRRGYSKLDEYLMGLLPASQAPDPLIWALDDGSHHGVPVDGGNFPGHCDTVPASGSSTTYTRVDVRLADVVRAMGTRSGPAAEIPTDWNVGFVLVAPSGVTPTQADIAKVDAYRTRFEQWFTPATDGLGHVHTELVAGTCNLPPPPPPPATDGGTPDSGPPPVVDAGTPDAGPPPGVDAGTPDAGPPPGVDAGTPDAGPPPGVDAGTPDAGDPRGCGLIPCDDGGTQVPDAGPGISTLKTGGCGCTASATSGTLVPALALVLLLGLKRRRRA